MQDFPEILSIKAILETALEKVNAIEKKMMKKPSKRVTNKQQRVDAQVIRIKTIIERNRLKKQNQTHEHN